MTLYARQRANSEKATRLGAALLDEKMPGWHEKIDLQRLRLASTTQCVLGQLFAEPQTLPLWRYYDYASREKFVALFPSANDADHPVCVANFALGQRVLGLSGAACQELGFDQHYAAARDGEYHEYRTTYYTLDIAWASRVRERQQTGETE